MHKVLDRAGELHRLPKSYQENKPDRFHPSQLLGIPGWASVGEFDYQIGAEEVREAYNNYTEEKHGDVEAMPSYEGEDGAEKIEVEIQTENNRLN